MMYMPHIIAVVAAFCLINPVWRMTSFIILMSSLFNVFIVSEFIVPVSTYEDLYFISGLTDAITAGLIIKYGNGGKYLQSGILAMFVFTNAMLLIELKVQPVFVYYHYENLIFSWNLFQIALFGGGVSGAFRRILDIRNAADKFDAGVVAGKSSVLHSVRHNGVANTETIQGQDK